MVPRSVYEGLREYAYRLSGDVESVEIAMANLTFTAK
jgi:hypothetical protein